MNDPLDALRTMATHLTELGRPFALAGGLALALHVDPRATQDVDLVVLVEDDTDAESLVRALGRWGWVAVMTVEQEAKDRLSTVRVARDGSIVPVDLIMATCGIEDRVVRDATGYDFLDGHVVPVAGRPHLVAMKLLSEAPYRAKDTADLWSLITTAPSSDIPVVRELLSLIVDRGYHRERDLHARFDAWLEKTADYR